MNLHYQMLFRIHYIHTFLYHYFFTILVTPNKQFLNLKLLVGFLGQAFKSYRQCKNLQFCSSNGLVLQLQDLYQILFLFYIEKVLCY